MQRLGDTREWDDFVRRFFERGPLGQVWSPAGGYEVPTDVFVTEDKLVVRLELPGVNPDDLDVHVQDNALIINGTRNFEWDPEKVRWVRRGVFYGDFTQRIALPQGLNTENITARYQDGILELTLPVAEEVKPKKISIETGERKAITG
jgi:HSP20 family protein